MLRLCCGPHLNAGMWQRVECFKRLVATHWSKPFAACLKVGGSCRLVVVCFVSVDQHLSCTTCTLCNVNQLVLAESSQ
jgi:hypothetical protein